MHHEPTNNANVELIALTGMREHLCPESCISRQYCERHVFTPLEYIHNSPADSITIEAGDVDRLFEVEVTPKSTGLSAVEGISLSLGFWEAILND